MVGVRLKSVRKSMGLSLRKFGKRLGEDFTLIAHIESGRRFPPKQRLEKFAKWLSLTPGQLQALIAVESRGLSPFELLPEIAPANVPASHIEEQADRLLSRYCKLTGKRITAPPIPIVEMINRCCGLSTEYVNFEKLNIRSPSSTAVDLYGCLFPDGFKGKDKVILVNTAEIDGRRLSQAEQMITIAHEAGHYVLHCGNKESAQLFFRFTKAPTFCRVAKLQPSPMNAHEGQATAFAACLLLPRWLFVSAWAKAPGDFSSLANDFGVTEAFIRFRTQMLNL